VEITNYQLLITNYQLSEEIDRQKTVNFPYNFDSRVAS